MLTTLLCRSALRSDTSRIDVLGTPSSSYIASLCFFITMILSVFIAESKLEASDLDHTVMTHTVLQACKLQLNSNLDVDW